MPIGLTEPRLKFSSSPDKEKILTEITGGEAFVYDRTNNQYLNGAELKAGTKNKFGKYQLNYNGSGWQKPFGKPEFEVLDENGQTVLDFSFRSDRPRALSQLIAGNLPAEMRKLQGENIRQRDVLEEWARQILILKEEKGTVRILDRASEKPVSLELSNRTNLTLKTPRSDINFQIVRSADTQNAQNITVRFQLPWRHSSPLPPASIQGCEKSATSSNLHLTVTSTLRPCDIVFRIPLGDEVGDLRTILAISSDTGEFIDPKATNDSTTQDAKAKTQDSTNLPVENAGISVQKCQNTSDRPPVMPKNEESCSGTSTAVIKKGVYSFEFATVKNLFSSKSAMLLLFIAWSILLAGLFLVRARMPEKLLWVTYGIILTIWNFLVFRLMLALRYALDPDGLDKLSVNGTVRAYMALVLIPGLLLLLVRLYCDKNDRPVDDRKSYNAMRLAIAYLVVITLTTFLINFLTPRLLWTGLTENSLTSWLDSRNLWFVGFGVLFAILTFTRIIYLYRSNAKNQAYRLFVSRWNSLRTFGEETSRRLWEYLIAGKLITFIFVVILLFIINVLFLVVFWLMVWLVLGDKLAQEVLSPLYFFFVALFWLGLCLFLNYPGKNRKTPATLSIWLTVLLMSFLTISLPAIFIPALTGDFGSLATVLAILLPLLVILITAQFKKLALPIIFAFILFFTIGGYFVYQNVEGFIPFINQAEEAFGVSENKSDRAFARLLNFKHGSIAQSWAIIAHRASGNSGFPYQELLNGNEHIWETQAVSYEGGWNGLGFGKSPNRSSFIRQDTLQYDSVFSFFIVAEYGLAGGFFLLTMYLFPLILIYISSREHFDTGHALALIIAASFLLEALYHAGMNFATFPMSGRNLPLLSVNSPSDMFKWTILFCLMIQAIFWRYQSFGKIRRDSYSIFSKPADSELSAISGWRRFLPEKWKILGVAMLLLILIVFGQVVFTGWQIARNDEINNYSYKQLFRNVRWFIDKNLIFYDAGKKKIDYANLKKELGDDPTFIAEEAERFNAYNEQSSETETSTEQIENELKNVRNLKNYNRILNKFRNLKPLKSRQNLFRLQVIRDESGKEVNSKLEINDDFNIRMSFRSGKTAQELPQIKLDKELLVAPAWENNRYRTVFEPETRLSWAQQLSYAMESEWKRLEKVKSGSALETYGQLTLNREFQKAAMDFVAEKGVIRHEELLTKQAADLPPRVALSIIRLPDGETLALGSYPRASAVNGKWEINKFTANNQQYEYIIPPLDWVEKIAPRNFRLRYGVDHNFERAMVMGSVTKPIWAAAVLKVHPKLNELLLVQSGNEVENSVFGLKIEGDGWRVTPTTSGWVNFKDYLKRSDNRYQVRLGMLGLANNNNTNKEGKTIIRASGDSDSLNESLTGELKPWKKYPSFNDFITAKDKELKSLGTEPNTKMANSPIAKSLHDLFGINIINQTDNDGNTFPEMSYRRSFWTKNTKDDVNNPKNENKTTGLLDAVSPRIPNFDFEHLTKPRDYVSLLLGGKNNLWSNVDLTGAFATILISKPVIPHIVKNNNTIETSRETLDKDAARQIRIGLKAAVEEEGGTAHLLFKDKTSYLSDSRIGFYAKTGTLNASEDELDTSRIVFAIIKWKDENRGEVQDGLVFSIVIEQGEKGKAVQLMDEFLERYASLIEKWSRGDIGKD
ncbi:MAG: hypothetical protein WA584_09490 [Pyrinomonadaceae bacterium]